MLLVTKQKQKNKYQNKLYRNFFALQKEKIDYYSLCTTSRKSKLISKPIEKSLVFLLFNKKSIIIFCFLGYFKSFWLYIHNLSGPRIKADLNHFYVSNTQI